MFETVIIDAYRQDEAREMAKVIDLCSPTVASTPPQSR